MAAYKTNNLILTVALGASALHSGCAALNSIYRSDTLPQDAPHLVSVDAKQRVILTNPRGNAANALLRFCAEPPPDVFSALAASLAGEASASKATSPEASLKLAASLSENAATIERTQTVNVLRETMYRNCERYLSGAITEDEFIVQAARDQQLIVQVLAVEQITGIARAQSTALTTIAKAAAEGPGDESLTILADAKKQRDNNRTAYEKAVAEAATLPPAGTCSDTPLDPDSPPENVTADQARAKNDKCTAAAAAKKAADNAEEYFGLVKDAVGKQGGVSSQTQGTLAAAALKTAEASADIADRVVEIVKQYQAFDEIGMTCVVKLRKEKDPGNRDEFCEDLLRQMARTRAAQLQFEEERLNNKRVELYRSAMSAAARSAADVVWNRLHDADKKTTLDALASEADVTLPKAHTKRLKGARSFEAFAQEFQRLPPDVQEKLAAAATRQDP